MRLSPASEFKPGRPPRLTYDVGTERTRIDKSGNPRVWVKIAEPNVWKLRAVLTWEIANGPLPRGCVVHHRDRDTRNDDLGNLQKMTRPEHLTEHRAEYEEHRRAGLHARRLAHARA